MLRDIIIELPANIAMNFYFDEIMMRNVIHINTMMQIWNCVIN